ncbi:hypothetical protein H0H92_005984 [Tricholoma furcatifolium]|nr:hypothetical protein H0H92_005984 [Tricholoma furcatifolium]
MSSHHRTASGTFRALSRHDTYYLAGGDLFFLVEHIHFRVHKYFFERESPFFQRQLQVPASPGAAPRGSTETSSIILEEPPEDFAKFLWVFYNPKYSLYKTSVEDWKIILRLAHKWEFAEVKNLVVRELEKLEFPDVDRIATYQDHGIDRNYLLRRYAALCQREQPLALEEAMKLGLETTLMIARAREYARSNPMPDGTRSPTSVHIREDEMASLMRQLFNIAPSAEISEAEHANGTANGAGANGNHSGGSPPPPPPKPSLVIPTDPPTVPPTKPTGKGAKPGKNQKGKMKGENATQNPPRSSVTTTSAAVQEVQSEPSREEEVTKAKDEPVVKPLIDLEHLSSSFGDVSLGTNGVTNGVDGQDESGEQVQNGDAGKNDESGKTDETQKSVEAGLDGKQDEGKVAENTTNGSETKAVDAGDS